MADQTKAVLGQAISYGVSLENGQNIVDGSALTSNVDDFTATRTTTIVTRQPQGRFIPIQQSAGSDGITVTLKGDLVSQAQWSDIHEIQNTAVESNKPVPLVHLTRRIVYVDGSSRVVRYIDGLVSKSTDTSSKAMTAALTDVEIKFSRRQG